MCVWVCSFFSWWVPPFFWVSVLCVLGSFSLRCLRGRLASSRLGVLVGSVLVPSLRRGSAFLFVGFPMSSSSFVVPSVSVGGPFSSFSRIGVSPPAEHVVASFAPVSLSPLPSVAWGVPVVLDRLGWEPSSRSVLVWVSGSSSPLFCRVGSSPRPAVSALVAELRALVRSGAECRLGVRGSWSGGKWFCAVAPV